MKDNMHNILVITPIKHIENVYERLKLIGNIRYTPDPFPQEIVQYSDTTIIFTNPNKSKVYLGHETLQHFPRLKIIVTASTGTVHIDKNYCQNNRINIICLAEELATLKKITSTAELALTATLAACRNYVRCVEDARNYENWNYESYIGRQIFKKNVGVIGYGRLGKMYAKYIQAMGSHLFVYEKNNSLQIPKKYIRVKSIDEIFKKCEIISLHIHATDENKKLISSNLLKLAKDNLILVNTSRGEIVDEEDIVKFLNNHPESIYATDVIANETESRKTSPLYNKIYRKHQLLLSQHIGGMTADAQKIAYNKAIDLLEKEI